MLESVQAALADVGRRYRDNRLNIFSINVEATGDGAVKATGRVLDATCLAEAQAALAAWPVEWSGVQLARTAATPRISVITNLTGVYAEPSFLAEMVSQVRAGAMLELLWEDGRWVYTRQEDGYLGWVYRPYLGEARAMRVDALVVEPVAELRGAPDAAAALATRLVAGTGVEVREARGDWRRAAAPSGVEGWLPAAALRLVDELPQSAEALRARIVADAHRYVGVPYLWGGASGLGIDCSGLASLTHACSGLTLPRDADMQCAAGKPVEFPYQPGDLLFFGEKGENRRVTHVAVSLGGWRVIHSSRSRNGVYEDDVQAVDGLRETFLEARTFIP